MKLVIQRVSSASVDIDEKSAGSIGKGLLILLGINGTDGKEQIKWLAKKTVELRIFEDEKGKMNRSLLDIKGEILLISQFTLYADCRKGRRPSFIDAARPEFAEPLYQQFKNELEIYGLNVETGIFGADMKVNLSNDGPVTIVLEKNHDD